VLLADEKTENADNSICYVVIEAVFAPNGESNRQTIKASFSLSFHFTSFKKIVNLLCKEIT
jgi:hypothetical protein